MKKGREKKICVILTILMLLTTAISFAMEDDDISNHWAKDDITKLIQKNIISKYPDGTFKPNNNITRAEFFKIINGVFGYKEASEINFLDVKQNDWFYNEIAKGVKAGYIEDSEGEIKPNVPITRQEVACILGTVFSLNDEVDIQNQFSDLNEINENSQQHILMLKQKGYISGYPDGTFKPNNNITRAEIAKIISNICRDIVNISGDYSQDVNGNLVINNPNTVLKNMTIDGDLYLTDGIDKGSVVLENVKIKGKIHVKAKKGTNVKLQKSSADQVVVSNAGIEIDIEDSTISKAEINAKDVQIKCKEDKCGIDELIANEEVKIGNKIIKKGDKIDFKALPKQNKTNSSTTKSVSTPISSGSSGGGSSDKDDDSHDKPDKPKVKNIISVQKFDDMEVEYGTQKSKIELPQKVEVTLDDKNKVKLDVKWACEEYDENESKIYTFEGKISLAKNIKNNKNIMTKINVKVKEKSQEPEEPENPTIEAVFNKTELDNFGTVSIKKLEGIEDGFKFVVEFKYVDGETKGTVEPVEITNGKTTEIFYNGECPVVIKIFSEDNEDEPLYIFEDVELEIKE